jgi:hypothetical protein
LTLWWLHTLKYVRPPEPSDFDRASVPKRQEQAGI